MSQSGNSDSSRGEAAPDEASPVGSADASLADGHSPGSEDDVAAAQEADESKGGEEGAASSEGEVVHPLASPLALLGELVERSPDVRPYAPIPRNRVGAAALTNVEFEDNSAARALSYIRFRRPMSSAVAILFCKMFDRHQRKLWPREEWTDDDYYVLLEVSQAYSVAGRETPPDVVNALSEFRGTGRKKDRGLKREFAAVVLPPKVCNPTDQVFPQSFVPSPLPALGRRDFDELDEYCRGVFGSNVGLSRILGPVYYLVDQWGQGVEPEDAKEQARRWAANRLHGLNPAMFTFQTADGDITARLVYPRGASTADPAPPTAGEPPAATTEEDVALGDSVAGEEAQAAGTGSDGVESVTPRHRLMVEPRSLDATFAEMGMGEDPSDPLPAVVPPPPPLAATLVGAKRSAQEASGPEDSEDMGEPRRKLPRVTTASPVPVGRPLPEVGPGSEIDPASSLEVESGAADSGSFTPAEAPPASQQEWSPSARTLQSDVLVALSASRGREATPSRTGRDPPGSMYPSDEKE